jgi:hypothetical protein
MPGWMAEFERPLTKVEGGLVDIYEELRDEIDSGRRRIA